MRKLTANDRRICEDAKTEYMARPNVTAVYLGFKRTAGQRVSRDGVDVLAVVIAVKKKLTQEELDVRDHVRPFDETFGTLPTDVVEARLKALSLTGRRRPCPPGYSVGHVSITAGTLGAWVRRVGEDAFLMLSNNHVLANSNDTQPQEKILQPGKVDGGFSANDTIARLTDYVRINFEGQDGGKDKKSATSYFWKASKFIPNALAKLWRCPFRLVVVDCGRGAMVNVREVRQPTPNLVDAALALPLSQGYVSHDTPTLGPLAGIADLELGDRVEKVGRTTEHTVGIVEGVGARSRVQYGTGIAEFDDQLIIRADEGDFSAGGDSGSGIVGPGNKLGGLLFAGGGGITIANRITHVVALLGVTT